MVPNVHSRVCMPWRRSSNLLRVGVVGVVMTCGTAQPAAERRPLEIRVAPVRSPAPTDLVVQAFIERDSRNRAVTFTVESPAFYGSSTTHLDGAQSPRTVEVRFRKVPRGAYQVRVTLIDADGESTYASALMDIL